MSTSANYYNAAVARHRYQHFITSRKKDNTTELFLELAEKVIGRGKNKRALDIGTGNGYVAKCLAEKVSKTNKFYAIDLSPDMIKSAKTYCKNQKNIVIIQGDNYHLPFDNNSINLVTNKVSTNFSIKEVFRVLKDNGIFVFKEYSKGKGMTEIANLFPGRIKVKNPFWYLNHINKAGFREYYYHQFFFKNFYTKKEIQQILAIAPIISDYKERSDFQKINSFFGERNKIVITSDPFIIVARK